ncbi:MAG: copper chaperone PCu(A)C [Longimicrobiales bacterium]
MRAKTSSSPAGTLAILLLPAFLWGCGGGGGPEVEVLDPWARPMAVETDPAGGEALPGVNSAVYLTVRNSGGAPDTLTGASSPAAERVEIHESYLEGDVMRMREVGPLPVPADGEVDLRPGGLHLMLVGLRESLLEEDTLSLVLDFRHSGSVPLEVPVRGLGMGGR